MTKLTEAEQERLYDLQRSGQLYVRQPEPVNQDDQLISVLEDLYGSDDEQPERPKTLMLALADFIQSGGAEMSADEQFAAGYAAGQALGRALTAQEIADQETIIAILDECERRDAQLDADEDAIIEWIRDMAAERQTPADVDRDYLAGRAGAMMTMLYRKLDDRRADELVCLIEELLNAEPAERDRLADLLIEVE